MKYHHPPKGNSMVFPDTSMPDVITSGLTKLIIFGGKGDVGKTTCAATTALHLPMNGGKIPFVSNNPRPSRSSIFQQDSRCEETNISVHLYDPEIGPQQFIDDLKGYCRTAIFEIVSSVMPVMRVDVDGIPDEIMPGLDELMAMEYLMVWMTQGYNSIISDATPTAHTWCLLHLSVTPEHDATGGMKRYDQTVGTVKTMPIWFDKNMFHATIREILSEIRRSAELIRSSELIQSASGSF